MVAIKIREMKMIVMSDDESIIEEFDTILENIRNNVNVVKLLKIKTTINNINLYPLIIKPLNTGDIVL